MHSVALDTILLINIIVGIYIYIVSIPGRPGFNKIVTIIHISLSG
jgi:hypothetical protein